MRCHFSRLRSNCTNDEVDVISAHVLNNLLDNVVPSVERLSSLGTTFVPSIRTVNLVFYAAGAVTMHVVDALDDLVPEL